MDFKIKKPTLKFVSVLILTVIYFHSTMAQDYQVIRENKFFLFKPDNKISMDIGFFDCFSCDDHQYLRTNKIDSSSTHNDTIELFPYHEFYTNSEMFGCYQVNGNSWLGNKILILKNGENDLIYEQSNTIKIITTAIEKEKWTSYIYKDSTKLIATVDTIDAETIDGSLDSVKTIVFSLDASPGKTVCKIKLSKNNGLIELCDFRELIMYKSVQASYILINEDFRLKYSDVFNFNIGDEFHYYFESTKNWAIYHDEYQIKKIIDKQISSNSLNYIVKRIIWGEDFNPSILRYVGFSKQDIVNETYNNLNNYVIDDSLKVPFEVITSQDYKSATAYLEFRDTDIYNNRQVIRTIVNNYTCQDTNCYSTGFDSRAIEFKYFIDGCGVLVNYELFDGPTEYWMPAAKLIYYKKGSEKWGTPLNPLKIHTTKLNESELIIFPNPTHGLFFINTSFKINSVQIIDIAGRSIKLTSENYNLFDISKYPNGIYIILLQELNKKFKIFKY